MSGNVASVVSEYVNGSGLITTREPQQKAAVKLPAGLVVVSADNHIEITADIFYEGFPRHLRDRAPRVWFDRYWRLGYRGGQEVLPPSEQMSSILERIIMNSGFDLDVRWSHLATEGTKKELVYPQNLLGFIRFPDLEVQENVYRTYNEYLALLQREKAGLFYGVGVCSNWWDPAKAEDAIRQIVDLGLKTYMIPITPGKDANGNTLNYTSAEMDRLWSVAEEAGLPVAFHTGESASFEGRGGFARNFVVAISPYRKTFSELVFGGIFDRHPALRIVFAEAGMAWVPSVLQDSELTFEVHRDVFDIKPKLRPSEYWHKHCYASFQIDPVGLELLKYVGADRVMWAADYPHSEGTFGFTWDSMNAVIDATSETDARKILGDTATELFQL